MLTNNFEENLKKSEDDLKKLYKEIKKQAITDFMRELPARAENNGMGAESADYRAGYNFCLRQIRENAKKFIN